MRKKFLTLFLATMLIISSFPMKIFAGQSADNIGERTNMELLNAILQERPWVLETLLEGDISNNPYAMMQTDQLNRETFLMPLVLKRSTENVGLAVILSALEVYSSKEDCFSDAGNNLIEMLEFIKSCCGVETDEEAMEIANNVVASIEELKYEAIFNDIIKSDYTASWGETLLDEDSNLENLRQRSKALKKIKAYQTALKDCIGFPKDRQEMITVDKTLLDYGKYLMTLDEYAANALNAYEQDLQGYLEERQSQDQ